MGAAGRCFLLGRRSLIPSRSAVLSAAPNLSPSAGSAGTVHRAITVSRATTNVAAEAHRDVTGLYPIGSGQTFRVAAPVVLLGNRMLAADSHRNPVARIRARGPLMGR